MAVPFYFGYFCFMADVHNKKQRSYNMSRIKGKDTKPEMLVRRFLHANGYRYKLHGLRPSPDGEGKGGEVTRQARYCFTQIPNRNFSAPAGIPKSSAS